MNRFLHFFSRQKRFCMRTSMSPTYYNLYKYLEQQGWLHTRFNWLASFGERNFQFNSIVAEELEFKHLLAQLIAEYCPQVMPETHHINDQNWPVVLYELADKYGTQKNGAHPLIWILKPSTLNNGQYIKIFQNLDELEQHYISPKRLGGEHVLQSYLSQPHLLKNHKYSIRMFVIITNYGGVYLYPQGYLNVSLHPYQPQGFENIGAHLTNEHLNDDESNVVQIPTQRMDEFPAFYLQIKTIVEDISAALQDKFPQSFVCTKKSTLAIFGFDFMVDSDKRVWLLEANHGPCFPTSDQHPLQSYVYYDFWQAFISDFVEPIASKKEHEATHQFFDKIGRDC